jgi:hypothetical protein
VKVPKQRICIKFCFKVGKTATETYELLQQAYGVVHRCLTGSVDLNRVEPPLKATPAREVSRKKRGKKVMLLAFFDSEGIVHHKYAPNGQSINQEFYLEVLRCLRVSVRRKRPEKWRDGDLILHHDNAPAHNSHLVQQPPYSPDLAPFEFFLFPRLKKVLKGHRGHQTKFD